MKLNNSLSLWTACGLGATHGLVVGFALEYVRVIYLNHQIEIELWEAVSFKREIGFILRPGINTIIPLICMILFATVCALWYSYLKSRPHVVLVLFAGETIIVFAGNIGTSDFRSLASLFFGIIFLCISSLVYFLWKRSLDSVLMLWQVTGILGILTVAATTTTIIPSEIQGWKLSPSWLWSFGLFIVLLVNLVYGTTLQLIFTLYGRNKGRPQDESGPLGQT